MNLIFALLLALPAPDNAREAVTDYLAALKITDLRMASLQELDDPALREAFPASRWFLLRYRLYPVAKVAPEPLHHNNLFFVAGDLKVKLILDADALLDQFRNAAPNIATVRLATAWALLYKELVEDGMYH